MIARVVAIAGRRVDAPGAPVTRFPAERIEVVRERLRKRLAMLAGEGAKALVASAACGADLLALDEAAKLGIRLRVVLPFEPTRFRAVSVVDRPGDWGPVFDRLVREAQQRGDLLVLANGPDADAAFAAANERILQEALDLTRDATGQPQPHLVTALVIWDGASRGVDDLTAAFRASAVRLRLVLEEVPTR